QPGIESCGGLKILVDSADAGHLAVEGQARNLRRVYPTGVHALAYCHGSGLVEILHILFHRARLRVVEWNFGSALGNEGRARLVKGGFGGSGAEVNAEEEHKEYTQTVIL